MAVHYRTQGFIIKKTDRGEANQLLTIYTEDFGKLKILGKAIRKIKSKLRGGTGLFCLSEIEFIQGKTHKTLTDAILINSFLDLKNDLKKLKIIHQIADVLDHLVVKEENDEQVWGLLNETFEKLKGQKPELVYYYFFWNLISVLGYGPELKKDSIGGKKIDTDLAKILKLIFKKNWQILSRLKIEPRHFELLKNTSEWYNKNI